MKDDASPTVCASSTVSPGGAPDLLFDDIRDARVIELRPHLEAPAGVADGFPLHRVTVFLTYRCNLACPYCRTIPGRLPSAERRGDAVNTYTLERFAALLERVGDMPVRHLHLIGGEASMLRTAPAMVAMARARGVAHVSMTSNGSLEPARYVALIEAGLTELRLSIDAHEAVLGERMSGRRNVWSKAIDTLRAVVAARQRGANVRIIVNTVVSHANRGDLLAIVRYLVSEKPDDLKLITDVAARDDLADFAERDAVVRGLAELVAALPASSFPLLRLKLRTVFAKEAIGLDGTAALRDAPEWRCYVPLSERTFDGEAYYPCSVYLREGGAPIGSADEPAEVQRQKTAEWVAATDCRKDPICRSFCLHCTRVYNDAANRARQSP